MAASFLTSPAAWSHSTSGSPSDNISTAPAGSNRKLVVTLGVEDADTLSVTTMQVGGQNPDVTHSPVDTNQTTQEARIRSFEWFDSTIDAMSGVALTYADTAFISPIGITHYWLQGVTQISADQFAATITGGALTNVCTVTSVVSESGDMVVGVAVSSDDTWDVTNPGGWDGLGNIVEDETNANYYVGLASSADITQSQYDITFDTTDNVRAAVEILVHAQAATAPDFSSAPTVTSQSTTTYNLQCTADSDCTFYQVCLKHDATAPSVAQIKSGLDSNDNAAPGSGSTSLTASMVAAPAVATLAAPINDIYMVLSNGGGDSPVYSLLGRILDAPTGKQYVEVSVKEIAGATRANPCVITSTAHGFATGQSVRIFNVGGMTELNDGGNKSLTPDDGLLYYSATPVDADSFSLDDIDSSAYTTYTSGGYVTPGFSVFEAASPDVVDGDLAIADTATDPDGYVVTFNADGTLEYAAGGDESRQAVEIDVYDVSAGASVGAQTYYFNNRPPELSGGPIPPQDWPVGDTASIDLSAYIYDLEGDSISWSVTNLPSGMGYDGSLVSGTPDAEDSGSANVTAQDAIGDSAVFTFQWAATIPPEEQLVQSKRVKGMRAVRYFITIDGERIEIRHPDEAVTLVEQYERDKLKQNKIRRVITDSIKLQSTDIPIRTRERYVQRAIQVDKKSGERIRYAQKHNRKISVELRDRVRFVQEDKPQEDVLERILRRRG